MAQNTEQERRADGLQCDQSLPDMCVKLGSQAHHPLLHKATICRKGMLMISGAICRLDETLNDLILGNTNAMSVNFL